MGGSTPAGSPDRIRPAILAAARDQEAALLVEDELSRRYGADYAVLCERSGRDVLQVLRRHRAEGADVALVLVSDVLSDMSGIDLLGQVHQLYPPARRALLLGWGDAAGFDVLRAATLQQIDDWITVPTHAGDEHFHQGITRFLYDWARSNGTLFEIARIVGDQWDARSAELRDVLTRNSVPFAFVPADTPQGRALREQVGAAPSDLPVVALFDGRMLRNPSNQEIALALGIRTRAGEEHHDVVIIGAGPAGLAAAVYAASEGLRTTLLEPWAIGGQAGTSSMIRNYLGFPRGISGAELAQRAYEQSRLLGAEFVYGQQAVGLRSRGDDRVVLLSDGSEVVTRAVLIATGVSYRRLGVPSLELLVGAGVFYGAATPEAQAMSGLDVYVVGGANSAGQAAVHLAQHARHVTVLVRRDSLVETMSDYLVKQIDRTDNIDVRVRAEVSGGEGEGGRLARLHLRDRGTGRVETVPAAGLFVLIGAEPRTQWLPGDIRRGPQGYVLTGRDLETEEGAPSAASGTSPRTYETSMPGVFAIGDVRHGSVKRVASSVGEGSVAIRLVHEYLTES